MNTKSEESWRFCEQRHGVHAIVGCLERLREEITIQVASLELMQIDADQERIHRIIGALYRHVGEALDEAYSQAAAGYLDSAEAYAWLAILELLRNDVRRALRSGSRSPGTKLAAALTTLRAAIARHNEPAFSSMQ